MGFCDQFSCLITDRVRSTTVRYCFHRCLPGYPSQGAPAWGTPRPGQDGGYPSQGEHPTWGTPLGRSGWEGYHNQRAPARGTPPSQVRREGNPAQGEHPPGVPPCQVRMGGVPQPGYPPPPVQDSTWSTCLLHSRRRTVMFPCCFVLGCKMYSYP